MSDNENEDAADFFFFASQGGPNNEQQQQRNNDAAQTTITTIDNKTNQQSNSKKRHNKNVAALLSAQDVLDMSQNLLNLASEAPNALSALSVCHNNNSDNNTLPQMSMSELRRQQTRLSDWSERVVVPLSKLVVRWEEEVVLNFEDLIHYLYGGPDGDDDGEEEALRPKVSVPKQDLEISFQKGNDAMQEISKNRYAKKLKELVDEKKRELRLAEDLLNCGVWEDL